MTARTVFRRIHLVATIWLMSCVIYLLTTTLHQAGLHWWQIFPLSGQSTLVVLLLISVYLFAVFRGLDGRRYIEIEHPLTSSDGYLGIYVSAPLLGGLAALLAAPDTSNASRLLCSVATGTLEAAILAWIVIDPAAQAIETLLPASRRHRAERMAERARLTF
ncbi:MAG: hypothetical protein ACM3VT_15280 [Solirubrobacterales bacterium]